MFEPVIDYTAYAGIGSRETPGDTLGLMRVIAKMLDENGYTLRSGGALGADRAFEEGAVGRNAPELYLPWDGYNGKRNRTKITQDALEKAEEIAARYHPAWHNCSQGARKMHTRNVLIVLGPDLTSWSKFVVCWTPKGKAGGGTGEAIRVAQAADIPVFDLYHVSDRARFYPYIGFHHEA